MPNGLKNRTQRFFLDVYPVQGQSPSNSKASRIGDAPGVPDPLWLAVVVVAVVVAAAVIAVVSFVDYNYNGDIYHIHFNGSYIMYHTITKYNEPWFLDLGLTPLV